jgi:hypothetical protein
MNMTKDIGTVFNFAIFDWRTIIYALSIGPLLFQTNNCRVILATLRLPMSQRINGKVKNNDCDENQTSPHEALGEDLWRCGRGYCTIPSASAVGSKVLSCRLAGEKWRR